MRLQSKSAFIILNPTSGQGDPKQRKKDIIASAKALGWEGKLVETTKLKSATVLAQQAIANGAKHIVVCGGDGTIMEALQAVVSTKVTLGIVPLGTGNLLAQNLNLPLATNEAMKIALTGKQQKIDLGRANDTYFAIIAGMGFDAHLMRETKRELKDKYGFLAYLISGVKAFNKKSKKYEIVIDNNPSKIYKAKNILIANMGKIQAGIEAVPNAHHQSGFLHIAVIQASTFRSILSILGNALLGKVHNSPHYTLIEGKNIKITSLQGPQPYECDGNHFPPITTLDVTILPKALTLFVDPKEKQNNLNPFSSLLQF